MLPEKLDYDTKSFAFMAVAIQGVVSAALEAGMTIREIEPALLPAHPGEPYGALSDAQQAMAAEIKSISKGFVESGGSAKEVATAKLNAWQYAADATNTDFGPGQWR